MKKTILRILFSFVVVFAFVVGFGFGEVRMVKTRLKVEIICDLQCYKALLDGKPERAKHFLAVQLQGKSRTFDVISRHPLNLFRIEYVVPTDKNFVPTLNELQSHQDDIEHDASGF